MDQKVIWTEEAEEQFFGILEYWKNRTQSFSYSIKIKNDLDQKLELILQNPFIGKESELPGIRSLNFLTYFKVVYGIYDNQLVVLNLFDMRQDSDKNPFW
jgi:plasmid stabilization system protein ParE